jgi:hypothetical protein
LKCYGGHSTPSIRIEHTGRQTCPAIQAIFCLLCLHD